MGRPQVSFAKRQREQAKREKQQLKAERRAQRKVEETTPGDDLDTPVRETALTPDDPSQTTP